MPLKSSTHPQHVLAFVRLPREVAISPSSLQVPSWFVIGTHADLKTVRRAVNTLQVPSSGRHSPPHSVSPFRVSLLVCPVVVTVPVPVRFGWSVEWLEVF
ncbi:hypothetical protein VTI74DRAFT_4384 [Chaetomium olivicolor]